MKLHSFRIMMFVLIGVLFLTISVVFAEIITLKSGKTVEGKIIERTDKFVKIDFQGVPLTYFKDEIESIDNQTLSKTPQSTSSPDTEEKVHLIKVAEQMHKKGTLVVVGDANLTYAAYSFELPSGWVSAIGESFMQYTHERGFWRSMRNDSQTVITIMPTRKENGLRLADFINTVKKQHMNNEGCPSDSIQENLDFKPSLNYPYKVYTWNCPQGSYGLSVFIELPEHIIFINLFGKGRNSQCINPYFADFEKVLTSFKWLLETK